MGQGRDSVMQTDFEKVIDTGGRVWDLGGEGTAEDQGQR